MMKLYAIVIFATGLFSICSAIFNWDWCFRSRKVKRFMNRFGRKATRIVWFISGVLLIILEAMFLADK